MPISRPCPSCGNIVIPTARLQQEAHLIRKIMTRLYARERDRKFTMDDARETLRRFQQKSIWGGGSDSLTITRIDKTIPLTLQNAMVLEVPEAFRHAPPWVMEHAKAIHEQHISPSLVLIKHSP